MTNALTHRIAELGLEPAATGLVVVDHGSHRASSNELLLDVVRMIRVETGLPIVEPAHMELAEPSVDAAYARCVEQGARLVIVYPYFLLPGRHWHDDIPRLAAAAAARHPGTQFIVPAPLGLHPLLAHVVTDRITDCLRHAIGTDHHCPICAPDSVCRIHTTFPSHRDTISP